MALKKSEAYLKMQKQFRFVGAKPQAFTSLKHRFVRIFEIAFGKIESNINLIAENIKNEINTDQLLTETMVLTDSFYKDYVRDEKFKNHIDVWNKWQKLEDKFNDEIGIELEYAAPIVKGGKVSPPGKKSAAYMKFQRKFISSVGLKPDKYNSILFKRVKKFKSRIYEIRKMLSNVAEHEKKGEDGTQSKETAQTLMDNFYIKYVRSPKFKNHIDVWNEFMKLEDKFNELGINLSYAEPIINS